MSSSLNLCGTVSGVISWTFVQPIGCLHLWTCLLSGSCATPFSSVRADLALSTSGRLRVRALRQIRLMRLVGIREQPAM